MRWRFSVVMAVVMASAALLLMPQQLAAKTYYRPAELRGSCLLPSATGAKDWDCQVVSFPPMGLNNLACSTHPIPLDPVWDTITDAKDPPIILEKMMLAQGVRPVVDWLLCQGFPVYARPHESSSGRVGKIRIYLYTGHPDTEMFDIGIRQVRNWKHRKDCLGGGWPSLFNFLCRPGTSLTRYGVDLSFDTKFSSYRIHDFISYK